MYYVGVDLHKETSWFYIVDSRGKKYDGENIQNKPGGVQRVTHPDQGFFRNYPPFTWGHACTSNPFAPGKYLPQKIVGTMLCPIGYHKPVALRPTLCGSQHRRTLLIMPFRLFLWMEQIPNHISWFDYQPQHRFTVPFYNSVTYLSPFYGEWNSFHFVWVL